MARDSHVPREQPHSDRRPPDREVKPQGRKGGSQGIVRDQRGQEQPADKERAQQVSKSK